MEYRINRNDLATKRKILEFTKYHPQYVSRRFLQIIQLYPMCLKPYERKVDCARRKILILTDNQQPTKSFSSKIKCKVIFSNQQSNIIQHVSCKNCQIILMYNMET